MKLPCCRRLPAGVTDAEQACQRRVRCVWRPCRTGLLSILPERISGETEGNEAMSLEQVTNADQPLTDDEAMLVRVQREDFSIDEELRRVRARSKRIGGIAIFLGTARDRSKGKDVDGITFEHYEGMAQKKLRDIRERALKDFGVIELLILHRYGEIGIGDNIVLIIAGAEHRAEAFQACKWAIDELKQITPIWKLEHTPDGEVWVEEHP